MSFHVVVGFTKVHRRRIDQPQVSHARDVGNVLRGNAGSIDVVADTAVSDACAHPRRHIIQLTLVNVDGGLPVFGRGARGTTVEDLQNLCLAGKTR